MCPFESFEHTADIGLRVTAPNLSHLFADAGRGFFALMVDNLDDVRATRSISLELEAGDPEALMVDWLNELLFRFETESILLADFDVTVRDHHLTATARGEPIDFARHDLHLAIKAVTYHNLRVEPTDNGWLAEVILDI